MAGNRRLLASLGPYFGVRGSGVGGWGTGNGDGVGIVVLFQNAGGLAQSPVTIKNCVTSIFEILPFFFEVMLSIILQK